MRRRQPLILVAIILFLSFAVLSEIEEKKAASWIAQEGAALPEMKPAEREMKGMPGSRNKPYYQEGSTVLQEEVG